MAETANNNEKWLEAEEKRKAGKYNEALPIFEGWFKENADEGSLWRIIYCARKLGNNKLVLEYIEDNKFMIGVSEAFTTQFYWFKYETCVEKYKKSGNWETVLSGAEELLKLCGDNVDNVVFRLALFSGIDAAKALSDYSKILELTDTIGPEKLPEESELFGGKKTMSYRERWYYARLNALYELKLYDECIDLAKKALSNFPDKIEFLRRGALSLMMLGKQDEAEKELIAITKKRGCPWYIEADLAKLRFSLGKFDEALNSAYKAALMQGELQTKVNVFTLIAKIQLVLGERESAKNHAILACSIRTHHKWKYTEELKQLASRFGLGDSFPIPQVAAKACEVEWKMVK